MIAWADRPRSGSASLSTYANSASYFRLSEKFTNPTLFGTSISPYDIIQGQISDCYWITACSAAGDDIPSRVKGLFVNSAYSSEGLFAINLYIRGKRRVVTIDDYLPFVNGNLIFNRKTSDADFWAVLLEKAFAKINGNYEYINWGW